ncbi:MAG TPA: hypothetical protein VGX23_28770 [Actinocrinis sp.]|nr:hypothetical protein [Actinocrinis sp.]
MATARFQYGNPARPAGGAVPIRSAAWRLIGGNNRDLGCCPAEFADHEASRLAVLELRSRVAEAVPMITINPQTSEWTWRLELDGRVVARSVRGYLRHRECLYNVSHFLGSVPVAALPGEPADPAALLAAKAPAAAMAWMAAILAIEAARTESGRPGGVADEIARARADAEAAKAAAGQAEAAAAQSTAAVSADSRYTALSFPGEAAFGTTEAVPCHLAGGVV